MRIIAGRFRGRPLKAPRGLTTRPTTDRVREALFQILGDLTGANVLDCFAGSGALGIEALSRGARRAILIESNHGAARAIRDNLEKLQLLSEAVVVQRSVERSRAILERSGAFDLVLSDPPWSIAQPAAELVARTARGLLAPDARVVLGHPADQPVSLPESSGLELEQRRRWGGSGLSFYRPAESDPESNSAHNQ